MAIEYEVTATRKRPQTFSSLVGQGFVVATLMNSLKTGRIAHAYLFSGSRGIGKTSAARILARALNSPDESLMGTEEGMDYHGAEDISRGTAIDVIEIDGASNTSVNDVRAIKDEILFPPQSSRYKIYIIDEVHMLSNSAFNALLKTIEEPPKYVIFIFATTEIHKVPATIRSRCQQFNFRLIPQEDILVLLQKACADYDPPISAEEEALFWIAREASGSMRDAYTILDQVIAFSGKKITLNKIKDTLGLLGIDEMNTLVCHIVDGEYNACFTFIDTMFSSGTTVEQFIIDLSDYFRSILFIKQGVHRDGLLSHPRETFSVKGMEAFTVTQLEKILELLLQTYRDIRYTLNDRLELELLIAKLLRIRQYFEPDEIIGKIEELRTSIAATPASNSAVVPRSSNSSSDSDVSSGAGTAAKPSPSAPLSHQAAPSTTLSRAMWDQVIKELQSQSPIIAPILEGCSHWEHRNAVLRICLESVMHIETLKQNRGIVTDTIKRLFGIDVTLEPYLKQDKIKDNAANEQIETIREIFHGEVVK